MDSTQTETVSSWLIIGAYIFPFIVNITAFIWQMKKDKKSFQKIDSDIEHQDALDDLETNKLSLEWAREFRTRLAEVEAFNDRLGKELDAVRLKNLELESKVRSLEDTNRALQSQLSLLQVENTGLTTRVKELEGENRTLKGQIAKLQLGGTNGIHSNP